MSFTVEQHTIEFPLRPLALSKAIIIVSESLPVILGTQSTLPLFAIIWSNNLVATLCKFFLKYFQLHTETQYLNFLSTLFLFKDNFASYDQE